MGVKFMCDSDNYGHTEQTKGNDYSDDVDANGDGNC